jgi:hypothetical protein
MSTQNTTVLEQLGRDAAISIAGEEAVQRVEVVPGERLDRPVYYFSFLIDKERSRLRQGLLLSRLVQRLGDELTLRGDERRPVIRLLDHADWDQRWRA